MAESDNARLARTFYESWNERDFDRGAKHVAEDGALTIVGSGERFEGPDGFRHFSRMWADAFPDGRVEIDSLIEAGDRVVVEFVGRGTHTGPLVSRMGEIPPTG
jgi:predicted ester cyclase